MKDLNIQFIKHVSPTDIVIQYFRYDYPRMKVENILKKKTDFELELRTGRVYPSTVADVIEAVTDLGLWGFCDKITHGEGKPDIHYWISDTAKDDKIAVMELFAHEISHASGYKSEGMAMKFGGIAAFSYMSMMEEVYKNC